MIWNLLIIKIIGIRWLFPEPKLTMIFIFQNCFEYCRRVEIFKKRKHKLQIAIEIEITLDVFFK